MSAERIKAGIGFWRAVPFLTTLDKNNFFEVIKHITKRENYDFILYQSIMDYSEKLVKSGSDLQKLAIDNLG
jgi:hypothetical protein